MLHRRRMSRRALLSLLLLFLSPLGGEAQISDTTVRRLMERHSVPGLALAMFEGDSVVLSSWGHHDARGTVPVSPDTPFRIASVAKVFVAATALTVAPTEDLGLLADLGPTLDFPLSGGFSGPVGMHDLLTHTAGFDERLVGYAARTPDDMRPLGEYLASRMPERGRPVGEVTAYSNHGMALAALVVQSLVGRSFSEVAAERVFQPLGMGSTHFLGPGDPVPEGAAQPLSCTPDACTDEPHVYSNAYPAGLAYSTARDMGRFIEHLLTPEDRTGVARDALIPQRFTHDARIPGMSYGFFNQVHHGRRALAHSGTVPGYRALLLVIRRSGRDSSLPRTGATRNSARPCVMPSCTVGSMRLRDRRARHSGDLDWTPEDPTLRAGSYQITRNSAGTIERFPSSSTARSGSGPGATPCSSSRAGPGRRSYRWATRCTVVWVGRSSWRSEPVAGRPTLSRQRCVRRPCAGRVRAPGAARDTRVHE